MILGDLVANFFYPLCLCSSVVKKCNHKGTKAQRHKDTKTQRHKDTKTQRRRD